MNYNTELIAKDFKFVVRDSELNYCINKLHKCFRVHTHRNIIDPFEIYRNLKEPTTPFPNSLCTFQVKSTQLRLFKHAKANTNIKDILEFIKNLDASKFHLLPSYFHQIKATDLDFIVDDVSLKLRDYCKDVFHQ